MLFVSCPRARKGFSRRANRDLHVSTSHHAPPTNTGTVFEEERSSGSVGQGLGECHGEVVDDHLTGLKLKLERPGEKSVS